MWLNEEPRRAGALKGDNATKRTRETRRKKEKTSGFENASVAQDLLDLKWDI